MSMVYPGISNVDVIKDHKQLQEMCYLFIRMQ